MERVEVVKVAWPELRLVVAKVVAPSLKVTEPVGMPLPGELAVTMAVKVTDRLKTEGLAEEVRAVAVPSLLTVWVRVEEVLALKLLSPP